ncbi:MAG: PilN domain-containing protein [Synechococcaceae cyanobacterium SM2_3_60]|nr:PilN domain-containing protein [Synechococcaceae cyanobacterium SM2_3_60]
MLNAVAQEGELLLLAEPVAVKIRLPYRRHYLGRCAGCLFVGSYTTVTLLFGSRLRTLEAQQTTVTRDLSDAEAEQARLEQLDLEHQAATERVEAFKSFFVRVQPWSLILEELRRSVPDQTWVSVMNAGGDLISISGESLDFERINDMQLALLQSPVVADARILNANVIDETEERLAAVSFSMEVQLSNTPVDQLLDILAARDLRIQDSGLQRKLDILRDLEVN